MFDTEKRRGSVIMRCSVRRFAIACVVSLILFVIIYRLIPDRSNEEFVHPHHTGVSQGVACLGMGGGCFTYETRRGRVEGLKATGEFFILDKNKFRIISGSFHYFRTHPALWADRLRRMKAAGLNTVTTYVAWNLHEPVRGTVDITKGFGSYWSLIDFIKLVQSFDMYVIVRPGPYICAEWELGGLPSWLLHDPNMRVRTSGYEPFLQHVSKFFSKLLPPLSYYTYMQGGPIIAFQIENEFGSYGYDQDYLLYIEREFKKHNLDALYFTSDGWKQLPNGTLPHILATVNFQKNASHAIETLRKFQPNRPVMVTEFWSGWFDHWTKPHHRFDVINFTSAVDTILSLNASINFYMFAGGTNFGFYNGANYYDKDNDTGYYATVTSYDYDAPVGEAGDCHPQKYEALTSLLVKHKIIDSSLLPPVPVNPRRVAYKTSDIKQYMTMDMFTRFLTNPSVTLPDTIEMEFLNINNNGGQSFGWILYRVMLDYVKPSSVIKIEGTLYDLGLMYINHQLVSNMYNTQTGRVDETIDLSKFQINITGKCSVELLVENMGRVNYMQLNNQRKGFRGTVTIDDVRVKGWEHLSLEFDEKFITTLSNSAHWKPYTTTTQISYPAVYRATFDVTQSNLADTNLDMIGWGKGLVVLNGFNLGRYWSVGPQRSLYVPAPLLKFGSNEIIVYELERPILYVRFSRDPILGL